MVLCGFLSVWTLPTNLYFLFGLATWVLLILFLPDHQKRFFKNNGQRKQKGFFFLKVAFGIAFLCLAAYAPVLNELIETLGDHQTLTIETQWQGLDHLIPGILENIFCVSIQLLPSNIKTETDPTFSSSPLVKPFGHHA